MSEFTKGEWKVNPTGDINNFHIGCICRFQTLGIADVETEYTGEPEALANARLIAAAPDLLEACEKAQKVFGFIAENYKSAPHFPNAERLVETAIAKAQK